MSIQYVLLYGVTVFVASIIPGPSMLLALSHGMRYGARRTLASALGNLAVTLLQAGVSIAGLGAVLLASEAVFQAIKWAGAVYLIYVGICLWRAPALNPLQEQDRSTARTASFRRLFLQGAMVTASNPKAIVFFTAVFPQFIDRDAAYLPQFSLLLGGGGFIAFACFMLYALGGQRIMPFFSRGWVGRHLNKVFGTTFVGAGLGLAASNR